MKKNKPNKPKKSKKLNREDLDTKDLEEDEDTEEVELEDDDEVVKKIVEPVKQKTVIIKQPKKDIEDFLNDLEENRNDW